MRETFIERRFSADSLAIIDTANEICADYRAQGFNLTLRQVYYQFVARGLLPNSDRSYKRLGSIVNDGRLAGLIDWSYIEDRTRNVRGNFSGYGSVGEYVESVADGYFEAIWKGQFYRPEVWVEKEALADVVQQAAGPLRVPTFSCRGYVSQSEMYSAAKRMQRRQRQGLQPVVIHLGDHDPSGIDMTRDIEDRLSLMSGLTINVRRIALNFDQIEEFNPPPNPAKISDSRGLSYIERFGERSRDLVGYGDEGEAWSWELDALEPRLLTTLIQETLDEYVDHDTMDLAVMRERAAEDRLRTVADRWPDLESHWDEVLEVIDQ